MALPSRVLRNFLQSIFLLIFFISLGTFLAQSAHASIGGIHIGDHFGEFDAAANIVGPGGWVVVMACPEHGEILNEMFQSHPEVHIVIRGHYPTQDLYVHPEEWALSWVATLGRINTDNVIYFVPWNEPNNGVYHGSSFSPDYYRDGATPSELISYINYFQTYLHEVGLDNKVFLLSPSMNVSNPTFYRYVGDLGGASFFDRFDAIDLHMYDNEDCGSPFCYGACTYNTQRSCIGTILSAMGSYGRPVFMTETGVVIHSPPYPGPKYQDDLFYRYLNAGISQWGPMGNFNMFAIFSYDPEHQEPWSIYGSNTADLINSISGGSVPTAGRADVSGFIANHSLYECDTVGVGYTDDYCHDCGSSTSTSTGGGAALSGYAPIHASRIIDLDGGGDTDRRDPHECDPDNPDCVEGEECRLTEGHYVCRASTSEGTYDEEDIRGFNYFDEVSFIDYSSPRARTVGGLARLLTPQQNADTSLHNDVDVTYVFRPLNMIDDPAEADHSEDIVLCSPNAGVNDDGSGRTDTTVPGNLWGRFVSASRVLQSGFDIPASYYMLTRPRVSLNQAGETCVPAAVGPGPPVADQNISHNARDRTYYYHKISTSEDVSDVLYTLTDRLNYSCDSVCPPDCWPWCWLCDACMYFGYFLEFISRVQKEVKPLATGLLPAVTDTVSSTDRVFGSLMAPAVRDQLDSTWESAALNVPVNFEATFEEQGAGGGATDSELIHSGGHANIRAQECIGHCYLLTPDQTANITDEDRLCPSCNPGDYVVEAEERNPCTQGQQDAGLSPQDCVPVGCTWGGDGVDACKWGYACYPTADYPVAGCPPDVATGTPVIDPGCEFGEGPVCEGCLDSPYSYVPGGFGFMDDCGGTGGERDCTADCNRCKVLYQTSWENDTYSDPRFNGCYYANVNVCVRNDIPAGVTGPDSGICMYLCSDACCRYCNLY